MSPSKPPEESDPDLDVACPHCDSTDVEIESAFGSSLMTRQYYCKGCRTVFERIKWTEDDPTGWLDP